MTSDLEYEKRFWTKVDKKKSEIFYKKTRCWEWLDKGDKDGYGRYYIGYNIKAHRYSYILKYGEFDKSLWVLHHCDNTKCVNPKHLFLGNYLDNVRDKVNKGRQFFTFGEINGMSKLKESDVIEIHKIWKDGKLSQKKIAKIFNVCEPNIWQILSGRSWKKVYEKINGARE